MTDIVLINHCAFYQNFQENNEWDAITTATALHAKPDWTDPQKPFLAEI